MHHMPYWVRAADAHHSCGGHLSVIITSVPRGLLEGCLCRWPCCRCLSASRCCTASRIWRSTCAPGMAAGPMADSGFKGHPLCRFCRWALLQGWMSNGRLRNLQLLCWAAVAQHHNRDAVILLPLLPQAYMFCCWLLSCALCVNLSSLVLGSNNMFNPYKL